MGAAKITDAMNRNPRGVRFGALGLRRADWSPMTKDGPKVRDVWASCSNLDPIINLLAEIFVYFPFARYFSVSAKTGLRLIVEDSLMSITKVEGKSPSPSRGRQIDIFLPPVSSGFLSFSLLSGTSSVPNYKGTHSVCKKRTERKLNRIVNTVAIELLLSE
jgi:hypothetical protein